MSRTEARIGSFVYVVTLIDRHADDTISLHATRAGADAEIDRFIALYSKRFADPRAAYVWTEVPRHPGLWERYVDAGDDAPKAMIMLLAVGE